MKDKRIIRLLKLFQMLQSGQGQNSDGLARACGVGRRTIFRDMETLRTAGVPLEFDAEAGRYSLSQSAFLAPTDLTADEILSILTLASTFKQQQRRLPIYLSAQSAAAKIERNLAAPLRRKLRRLTAAVRIRGNRVAPLREKTAVYQQLMSAIERRRVIQVEYESLTEWEKISTKLHPYQLLFSQHSWYIVGHSEMHGEVRLFNLSRIAMLTVLEERAKIDRSFDLDEHLGNAWHLMPSPGSDSHVVIRFKPLVAQNVAEVHLHKTQHVKFLPDGTLEFHAQVSGLNEIAWWILGYGDQAEVLKPAKLRQLIAQRAHNMAAMYDGNGAPPETTS
jgi:proteasome accessory factor B